jgi:arabinogalactan oligomer/maltooligosaccharide transport system permease protein
MIRGGKPARPFVTIESLFHAPSHKSREHERAVAEFSEFLAYGEGAAIRARTGGQVVAALGTAASERGGESLAAVVRAQALLGVPMPTHPNMRRVWEPSQRAAKRALRGDPDIVAALSSGRRLFEEATRPLPERRSPTPLILLFSLLTVSCAFWVFRRAQDPELRKAVRASLPAYAYVTHALVAVLLLVVLPLVVGAVTSLYAGQGRDMYFVGLANYQDILTARGGPLFAPGSFYLVLAVTILWTVSNLVLHVVIGVALALLLQKVTPGLSRVYRVILILPWAVPSYVTALSWKGMFHQQLGAINGILGALGVQPINWFAQWSTAFAANLATNAWLGFPFMMVVTLGALAAIPRELYEAAEVDGASEFDQARLITLPMIRPMLVPAMAMGAVWTFNMFNVIFLVSGGEPEGTTEILVSEAYRWAFTRSSQYGYAAAYAVLIFGLLLMGTRLLGGHSEARRA